MNEVIEHMWKKHQQRLLPTHEIIRAGIGFSAGVSLTTEEIELAENELGIPPKPGPKPAATNSTKPAQAKLPVASEQAPSAAAAAASAPNEPATTSSAASVKKPLSTVTPFVPRFSSAPYIPGYLTPYINGSFYSGHVASGEQSSYSSQLPYPDRFPGVAHGVTSALPTLHSELLPYFTNISSAIGPSVPIVPIIPTVPIVPPEHSPPIKISAVGKPADGADHYDDIVTQVKALHELEYAQLEVSWEDYRRVVTDDLDKFATRLREQTKLQHERTIDSLRQAIQTQRAAQAGEITAARARIAALEDQRNTFQARHAVDQRELARLSMRVEECEDMLRAIQTTPDTNERVLAQLEHDNECSICLDTRANTAVIPCGHSKFCRACLLDVRQQGNSVCPTCTGPIEAILPLY